MQPTIQIDGNSAYASSIRAEDGKQPTHWSVLCEGVLIPLGTLFAILLCIVTVMLSAK